MLRTAEVEEVGVASSSHWPMRRRFTSIVEDQGVYSSSCGYCKASARTSVAQGLWAHTLTVHDYQELLNRGWRRSGMFLYKPNMQRTCCPPYTIRLSASAFVPSKEQARVLRRMQRYLEGTYQGAQTVCEVQKAGRSSTSQTPNKVLIGGATASSDRQNCVHGTPELIFSKPSGTARKKQPSEVEDKAAKNLTATIEGVIAKCVESGSLPQDFDIPEVTVRKLSEKSRGKLKNLEGQLEYTSSVAFAVAAAMKRKQNKPNRELDIESDSEVNRLQPFAPKQEFSPVLVAEILVSKLQESDDLHGLSPQACKGHLNFLTVGCTAEKNASSPGRDTPSASPTFKRNPDEPKWQALQAFGGRERSVKPAPATKAAVKTQRIEIKMKRSTFDAEEFALYKKYQIAVHNDRPEEVKESSYCRFLVDSPLVYVPPENDGSTPMCGFGSFHQQYRIDGKLVAVGVVDILPHCLSSKYLFWDPDLAFLSLGKYSALREIQWVQEANKVCPSLSYYYLGYYIHSCPKMRYKAAYAPSELLCPVKYVWVPYNLARPALDRSQYTCLFDCVTEKALAAQRSAEKNNEVQNDEDCSSAGEDGDDEMINEASEARDAECEAMEGREHRNDICDMTSPHSPANEISEDMTNQSTTLGQIMLLLNNRCLSFKRLEELGVVPHRHMQPLKEQLNAYMEGVGPTLASRMAFALT